MAAIREALTMQANDRPIVGLENRTARIARFGRCIIMQKYRIGSVFGPRTMIDEMAVHAK
jgi:hypothetical protein